MKQTKNATSWDYAFARPIEKPCIYDYSMQKTLCVETPSEASHLYKARGISLTYELPEM